MNKKFYNTSDSPNSSERKEMWNHIDQNLSAKPRVAKTLHWRSFWLGNVAAIVLIFAGIGAYTTIDKVSDSQATSNGQVYEKLNAAVNHLAEAESDLLQQASMEQKDSMESTLIGIREIDRLIEEVKQEMEINGISPTSQQSLKRLYATKLDFYKTLLLTNPKQS